MKKTLPQSTYKPNPEMLKIFREVIRQGKLPKVLYKYWSIEGAMRFLETGQILFNCYTAFNDPFDCSANLDTHNTPDEWLHFLLSQGVYGSEAIFLASKLAQNPSRGGEILKDTIERQKLANGIFCTSCRCDSLLMWAHYADNHKGVCIGFDISKDMETFCPTQAVEYSDDYLSYNYLRNQNGALSMIFRKSTEWSYEHEYRTLHTDGYGLLSVRSESVKEIILGCKILAEDERRIRSLAKDMGYEAEFLRARQSVSRYELEIGGV